MSTQPSRLVLFDIDGTLIHGGPLWAESFLGAIKHHFPDLQIPRISFGGKTDPQIFREIMTATGHGNDFIEEHSSRVLQHYLDQARSKVAARKHEVEVLPGVLDLLKHLGNRPEVFLGLLTGNLREGAKLKLESADLHGYFEFGAFGDDHWDRYKLPTIALEKAQAEYGYAFSGKEVVIIGDTVHDVCCGKSIGVRSIAVGTGYRVPMEDLLAHDPDYYFRDLSATSDVIRAILEDK